MQCLIFSLLSPFGTISPGMRPVQHVCLLTELHNMCPVFVCSVLLFIPLWCCGPHVSTELICNFQLQSDLDSLGQDQMRRF